MHCLNLPRTKILKWTHGTLMLALILHQFTKYCVACFTQAFQPPIIGDNVKTTKKKSSLKCPNTCHQSLHMKHSFPTHIPFAQMIMNTSLFSTYQPQGLPFLIC